MRAFREAIDDCDLQDLGFSGMPDMWDNRQEGLANVKARIDRALGNEGLLNLFQVVQVKHISTLESDHCLIMTELRKHIYHKPAGRRTFRYEDVWQTHGIMIKWWPIFGKELKKEQS